MSEFTTAPLTSRGCVRAGGCDGEEWEEPSLGGGAEVLHSPIRLPAHQTAVSVQAILGSQELTLILAIKYPFSLCFQAKNRELLKQAAALSKGKKPEKSGAITSP